MTDMIPLSKESATDRVRHWLLEPGSLICDFADTAQQNAFQEMTDARILSRIDFDKQYFWRFNDNFKKVLEEFWIPDAILTSALGDLLGHVIAHLDFDKLRENWESHQDPPEIGYQDVLRENDLYDPEKWPAE